MKDTLTDRKLEHIHIIQLDNDADRGKSYFDQILLTHRALPEIDLAEVDPSVSFMGKKLRFPLLISSMTGGDHALLKTINKNLALAAEKTGVAMGVGSQRVMFNSLEARGSFALREHAPTTLLFSNLGAVQLNYGFTPDMCQEAVDVVGADGLFLHLNPLQEAVQSEGDTNFSELTKKIQGVVKALDVPVILKEVGSGFSSEDVLLAMESGIAIIDLAGAGGTSWSRIEQQRGKLNENHDLGFIFQDWGIPTPLALQQMKPYMDRVQFIASGGIRTGIDMAKAMALGASLCGMAAPFLSAGMESVERVVEVIENVKREFVTAMFLLGITKSSDFADEHRFILKKD